MFMRIKSLFDIIHKKRTCRLNSKLGTLMYRIRESETKTTLFKEILQVDIRYIAQ